MAIRYKVVTPTVIKVFLGKKRVGMISLSPGGWSYRPYGRDTERGEFFKTFGECKASLEAVISGCCSPRESSDVRSARIK